MNACLLPARSATLSVIDRYSHLHRSDCEDWCIDGLIFDDGGYLEFAIDDVQIDEIVYIYGVQVYYVTTTMYGGENLDVPIGDDDIYEAYLGEDGKWIVEYHGC